MSSPNPVSSRRFGFAGLLVTLVVALLALSTVAHAAGRGEPGEIFPARIDLPDALSDLKRLQAMDIDIEAVYDGWARAQLLAEELEKLRVLGYSVSVLPREKHLGQLAPLPGEEPPSKAAVPTMYHTYETLTSELQAIASLHPELVRVSSIGQSTQNRELWVVKISDNPDLEEDEPEVAYLAAMHGDEVVGKELCIGLINYLVDNYGTDQRVTDLVDGTEIWILPSMNPDGTALAQRYNAGGVDLNRDFPDHFADPVNTPEGRAPETKAVMEWTASRSLNLAANMHGGELVVNYPFDNNPEGLSVFSPAPDPDQAAFVSISSSYADHNLPIFTNPAFTNGVTNGAEWYAVSGGMQDWAYTWYGIFEVTLELSADDWPSPTQLPQFWSDNLESMLSYFERVHEGVRGLVSDAETGAPVPATVLLDSDPFPTYADPDAGDFHRIVLPGSYSMTVAAPGYASQTIAISVVAGAAVRYDVSLQPLLTDLQPAGHRVLDGVAGDGTLVPGETADMAVTLQNLGRAATLVGARLESTGWYAEVSRPTASYPDIGTGASSESVAPHYEVTIDPDIPLGHWPGFALRWTAEEGSGTSDPFFLSVGGTTCVARSATDTPQSILDNATTTSLVSVADGGEIDSVQVAVEIAHTYIADLTLTLTSAQGTSVVLHAGSGGSADDIRGTYPIDLNPAESLDALTGESLAGSWKLSVHDQASGDTGTLEDWSLEICLVESTTPEMRLRDLDSKADGVHLNWWPYPGLSGYRVYRSTDPSSAASFVDVTSMDDDDTDTFFLDNSAGVAAFYLVTGVGPRGEGPKGHFGE